MGLWIFVGDVWVVSPTRIKCVRVEVILWSIMKVVEGIGLFNSEVLK